MPAEKLYKLPPGWTWSIFSDSILKVKRGPSKKCNTDGRGVRYITSGNLKNGILDLGLDYKFLDDMEGIEKCRLLPDDLILNCVNSLERIGKSAVFEEHHSEAIVGFNNYAIELNHQLILPWYAHHFCQSQNLKTQLFFLVKRAINQVSFATKELNQLNIPLPPLNEQHRIVKKIQTLTTRSRKAREALSAINQHERTLVLYYTNKWKEEKLGEHIEEYKQLVGDDWKRYPSVGVSNSGFITKRKEPIAPKSAPRCKVVQPGDIVFNPIRFSIGSVARHYGREAVIVSPEYQVFRARNTISAELILRYLRSNEGKSRLEIATQGSVRYRVYLKNLKNLKMPIAPPSHQRKAEVFFSAINRIKEISVTVSTELNRLDQSILAKAFRGDLVPQSPTDEPAHILLNRIRAEREKTQKAKKKTKRKKKS